MPRGTYRVPTSRGLRRFLRRGGIAAALMAVLLLAAACNSTNLYPIDYFAEMHYSEAWTSQEPPRLDSPAGAVAFRGGNDNVGGALGANALAARPGLTETRLPNVMPDYTAEEMAEMENPLPRNERTTQLGQELYAINCAVCHGAEGDGNGPAAPLIFLANDQPLPADLRETTHLSPIDGQPAELTDGEYYYVIANGYGEVMPPFGKLLTPEEIWAIVDHIRQLQGQ